MLPEGEKHRIELIKKLRDEGKIKGASGRETVKLSLFDETGQNFLYSDLTKAKHIPVAADTSFRISAKNRFISPLQLTDEQLSA